MPETAPDVGNDLAAQPRLVTPKVAAEYCGVTPATIRSWIAQGYLRGYRTGPKLLRVDLADVLAMRGPA